MTDYDMLRYCILALYLMLVPYSLFGISYSDPGALCAAIDRIQPIPVFGQILQYTETCCHAACLKLKHAIVLHRVGLLCKATTTFLSCHIKPHNIRSIQSTPRPAKSHQDTIYPSCKAIRPIPLLKLWVSGGLTQA